MPNKKLPKLVVILGPTASGKTDLGIRLAKKFDGEIISADSRTIYKEMNIGTAKPLPIKNEECRMKNDNIIIDKIPHYMINIVNLNREFTVAQFKNNAIKIISDIHNRKKIPFVVGGAMLYIQALVNNFAIPRVFPDKTLRKQLQNTIENKGLEFMYNQLITLDPGAKDFVQYQNPRRVMRALEVCIKTKKPFSSLRKKGKPLFNTLQIGIHIERKKLYSRINARVDAMIEKGLVYEVKNLYQKYPHNLVLANTICYQEFLPYVEIGSTSGDLEAASPKIIEEIKKNTRHYARRQLTWWRKDKSIHWIQNYTQAQKLVSQFLR